MFAFDRSAIAVLAPLALLALVVAVSNYTTAPQPVQAMQQPEGRQDSRQSDTAVKTAMVAHNAHAPARH